LVLKETARQAEQRDAIGAFRVMQSDTLISH
jgi:hypothetical protein